MCISEAGRTIKKAEVAATAKRRMVNETKCKTKFQRVVWSVCHSVQNWEKSVCTNRLKVNYTKMLTLVIW